MKIDRLMAITIYLLSNGKTSAQKLAREFEVSTRTIMRDIDTLDQAGIPIQSSYGVDGGFQIMDTFVMDKQLASQNDYDFIVTALKGLESAYSNKSMKHTLRKMEVLAEKRQNPVSVDFSVAKENDALNVQIELLETALHQEKIVQFQYTNSRDEVKQVLVEPVRVLYKWYAWYLIGYCEEYSDYRMFKLARIEHLVITDKKNSRKHEFVDSQLNHNDLRNMIEIKLYGKAKVKVRCNEYLNGKVTKEYKNGDFEFCFSAWQDETYWYGVILSLGSDIRIIEPHSVIDRILITCNELIKEYGGENG